MLFLIAVGIFVPPHVFKETIGERVNIFNYLSLAWMVTSAATVAGAIGAGLENEEDVRISTYGYRQYVRSKEVERLEDEEENKEKNKER